MNRFLICLVLLLVLTSAQAQNTNLNYSYALKVYNQSSFEQINNPIVVDTVNSSIRNTSTNFQYLHPTIAFQWKTKRQNFREIELLDLYMNKNTISHEKLDSNGNVVNVLNKGELSSSGISLRYEYTVIFKKLKESEFVPSISYAANSYFKLDHFIPETSNNFNNMQSTLGLRGFIIPRLTYFLGSKLFVDLNVPICIVDFYYRVNDNENPQIPANQQRISNFNFELFPKVISVRLGVGLKI